MMSLFVNESLRKKLDSESRDIEIDPRTDRVAKLHIGSDGTVFYYYKPVQLIGNILRVKKTQKIYGASDKLVPLPIDIEVSVID